MTAERWSPDEPVSVEDVEGSARPAAYYLAESRDGLYVPYVVRTPADEGRFPFVFLAYGNGGGGIGWLRQWVHSRPYIMERLLAAGYACGWGRYRTEVDLGFNRDFLGPSREALAEVGDSEPQIALLPNADYVAAIIKLRSYDDTFLYVARPLNPKVLEQLQVEQSREFLLRREVLSPIEIIRQATLVGAEIVRMPGKLGVVKPGAFADILVVDGDPIKNLELLTGQGENLSVIMKAGRFHKNRLAG